MTTRNFQVEGAAKTRCEPGPIRNAAWIGLLMLGLSACGGGGGGGSTTPASGGDLVATFIDSPVTGLEFESTSGSGLTDTNGNFSYSGGDSVTFKIGNLYLGAATPANGKVTPLDLIGVSDSSNAKVLRILRTLQSLDEDGDASNGISISAAMRETLQLQSEVHLDSNSTTDEMVTGLIGAFRVSEAEAQAHFDAHRNDASNSAQGYDANAANSASTPVSGGSSSYALIAWNDLGMHCMDGKDFSVFTILPPYNNLHAQLVRRSTGELVTSGVTLSYEATHDANGSINTSSADKTNFWDWVQSLFGASPAANRGLNLSQPSVSNPTPSLTPAALSFNTTHGWWEAEGIPVTPYDDQAVKTYYPMVKVVARDGNGAVLASTRVVLPVSDEMSCKSCHASATSGNAARPAAGWVADADEEKDWKRNILRLHDEQHPNAIATAGMQGTLTGGTLEATAAGGKPILCASCHQSNALGTARIGSIKPLTEALHSKHASVNMPGTSTSLDASSNRDSCYLCHPGSSTKCLRGVMGNAKTSNGDNAIDCQSCHGNMSKVGAASRDGWLDEPGCQHCHDRSSSGAAFTRYTSVFNSSGLLRSVVDSTFASNANTPASGKSLYRFSSGHGGLQCEACHGATHAEYPSSHANDNIQSLDLQGHVGTLAECTLCHATVPATSTGGPHGLHTVGQVWVGRHGDVAERNATACKVCHGDDYRGGFLSKTTAARSFSAERRTVTYTAGQKVGCYDCHDGPDGDD